MERHLSRSDSEIAAFSTGPIPELFVSASLTHNLSSASCGEERQTEMPCDESPTEEQGTDTVCGKDKQTEKAGKRGTDNEIVDVGRQRGGGQQRLADCKKRCVVDKRSCSEHFVHPENYRMEGTRGTRGRWSRATVLGTRGASGKEPPGGGGGDHCQKPLETLRQIGAHLPLRRTSSMDYVYIPDLPCLLPETGLHGHLNITPMEPLTHPVTTFTSCRYCGGSP
ncbi:hypothetical protein ACOMHN_001251 [Nucella lapillus]